MNEEILNKVFHAYDIRGLAESELNDDFFYNLGKAFVTFLNAKKIAVGYDMREDSKRYSESFINGVNELGCDAVVVGEIATEMLYFTCGSDQTFDGGAVITASHNPSEWSGCKMVKNSAMALSKDSGLLDIKRLMQVQTFKTAQTKGTQSTVDIYPEFKTKILSLVKDIDIKKMRLVVDAGNGIGGKVFDYVFGDLDLEIVRMYFEPDGTFPNHVPDPIQEENVQAIKKRVVDEKADFGIAIDGDADRAFFIDNQGRNPFGVFTGAIYAKYFSKREKGARIIHDPRVTWPIIKEIEKLEGVPVVSKAGHSYFKEKMKEVDAIFGAEFSSHFYYRDFYYADSGMMTIALMLKLISEGLDFSKELDYFYSTYFLSGEVNYVVKDIVEVIQRIKFNYTDGKILEIDGISIEYGDWRFNLRASNTGLLLLRLNIESINKQTLIEKFRELESLIQGARQNIPSMKELI